MCHDDDRHPLIGQFLDDLQHILDHLRIQCAGRLIHQDDIRVHRQRPHDGQALFLSAGELARILVFLIQQTDLGQQLTGVLLCFFFALSQFQRRCQRDVLQHGQMRKYIEMLKDHAHLLTVLVDVHALIGDVHPFKDHLSLVRCLQQVQTAQERRLPAAAGSDDRNDLTLVDLFADAFQHLQIMKALMQVFYLNQCIISH